MTAVLRFAEIHNGADYSGSVGWVNIDLKSISLYAATTYDALQKYTQNCA